MSPNCETLSFKERCEDLETQKKNLNRAFENLKRDLEDALEDFEEKDAVIKHLKESVIEQEEAIQLMNLKINNLISDSEKKQSENNANKKHFGKD